MLSPADAEDVEDAENPRIPPWVVRAIALVGVMQMVLFYGQGVLSSLRPLFVILLISLFLSFALEPVVDRLELMGLRRGLGTAISFIVAAAAIVGFAAAVGTALANQIQDLVENAPSTLDSVEGWMQDHIDPDFTAQEVRNQIVEGGALNDQLTQISGDLINLGATVLSVLLQIFTVALFTFYLVAEGPRIRSIVCSLLPPARQRAVLRGWDLAIAKTGGYILSRAILGALAMVFAWVAFHLLGVPSPLAMALWVGVISQFLPVVGTYLAGLLPLLITVADDPVTALYVLIFLVVYQQFENYWFAPRITAHTMELHVAVAFGAVIAGGYILGPVGALLALPAAATGQAFMSTSLSRYALIDDAHPGGSAPQEDAETTG